MSEERYNFEAIETRWQARWEAEGAFRTGPDAARPKYYLLEMFPYPSGKIHMGHVRNYSIGDALARFLRMRGFNVLHPMGWDAFGMPAENAAIEHGIHPARWTLGNIDTMRAQLKRLGYSYDWGREVATCEGDYYRWNQWLFLRMLERDLAYRSLSAVNWCESCATVLANEQVEGGCCWRCERPVSQRQVEGWFLRITRYAEELLSELDRLAEGWPEQVLTMQRNWIGKSHGCEVDFPLVGRPGAIRVYTTRQDTLYGATFMLLAPEHALVGELSRGTPREGEVRRFAEEVAREDRFLRTAESAEKRGAFTGASCRNPLTGEAIPIWVANFVLMEYGTGAVMAVPAHDQRDLEFARKYRLPVRVVIEPPGERLDAETLSQAYVEPGVMVRSGPFDGLPSEEGKERVADHLEGEGIGRRAVHYRLRDWGISRQRYWGTPIPVIYCGACGTVPVPDRHLPVVLPLEFEFRFGGPSPLESLAEFRDVPCPRCGGPARRETDTMDTFVDSSWYFARFCSPRSVDAPFRREEAAYWMPVDQYVGGIEHAVLHLLYARFFTMAMRDMGLLPFGEPFSRLLTQGMVIKDGAKMSKSRGNVVDPDSIVARYGADTARLFILFAAPPPKELEWSDAGVEGASRFLGRVWRLVNARAEAVASAPPEPPPVEALRPEARAVRKKVHQTIRKVTRDLEERSQMNTAISALMELTNLLSDYEAAPGEEGVLREAVENLLLLLLPFTPHIAEELWGRTGHGELLARAPWPRWEEEVAAEEEITLVVQVNGRVRSRLRVEADASDELLRSLALQDEKVRGWVAGKPIRKVIVVPKRLVNIVV